MKNLNNLSVTNFGPVNKAQINISPLTVFVGKNNSGKSFLSSLIHCLSNPFPEDLGDFIDCSLRNVNSVLFEEFEKELNDYLCMKPSYEDESFKFSFNKFLVLICDGFGKCYTELIEDNLKNTFKTDLNNLNRNKKYPFTIAYNQINFFNKNGHLCCDNLKNILSQHIRQINRILSSGVKISSDDDFLKINLDYSTWMERNNILEVRSLGEEIYIFVVNELIERLNLNSFYISSDSDILNELNNLLINEVNNVLTPLYIRKEFITDFLSDESLKKGFFYNLACEMENEIYNGEIQITNIDFKEEFVFIDNSNNLELELNLVSSSVKQLTLLIVNLKYYLNKGDFLILEEIEKHLHPENQLILVKYLVKALNEGLNIILTTQSDYVLEKFNNLIELGNCEKEIFNHLDYDESCILDYNDISIYNFKKNADYSYTPDLVDINSTGFSDKVFSEVIDELYTESDIIEEYKIT